MKIALDTYMFRKRPLAETMQIVAELGFDSIELSDREDFLPWFLPPRADKARIAEMKKACADAGIEIASLLALYPWASVDQSEREAAVMYWRRAINVAAELGCRVFNSEFTGRPHLPQQSEAAFWKSLDELLPLFEKEDVCVHIEAHPDDFIEENQGAVDIIRGIDSPHVRYLYCAPHSFYLGDEIPEMLRYAAPVLAHVHVADSYNHRAGDGLRYIVNPFDSPARVHQHNDIGHGEVDWDAFFGTLAEIKFDGILTSCVLGWDERVIESTRHQHEQIDHYLTRYFPPDAP